MNRAKTILSRWISVVITATLAAIFWAAAEFVLARPIAVLVDQLSTLGFPLILILAVGVLVIAALMTGAHRRFGGWIGIRNLLFYPPLWVEVLIAALIFSFVTDYVVSVGAIFASLTWCESHPVLVLAAIASLCTTISVMHLIKERGTDKPTANYNLSFVALSDRPFDELMSWFSNDEEITHPKHDYFGHDAIARRIASRLTAATPTTPTIALVGPIGSGKSSIRALVAHHLSGNSSVRVINLSLWPYDSAEAAVRGILNNIVQELARHVNVLNLTGLSERYISVIENMTRKWVTFSSLLRQSSDPESILQQASDILTAIGIHFILWIEDLERFGGFANEEPHAVDEERLAPVRALLYLLDRSDQISVVISDASLHSRFDMTKIARFVEHPQQVAFASAWAVLRSFRQECLSGRPHPILDPVEPKVRTSRLNFEVASDFRMRVRHYFDLDALAEEALVILLKTPRNLKSALRVTYDTWSVLAGEVDFDDLLIMSAIRVARPDVFAFVDENIEDVRSGFSHRRIGGKNPKPEDDASFKRLKKLINRSSVTADEAESVTILLRSVFPALPPDGSWDENLYLVRPQGLAIGRRVDSDVDRWSIFTACVTALPDRSDQAAIKSIRDWQASHDSDLLKRILNQDSAAQIEMFTGLFNGDDLCRLLEEIARELLRRSPPQENCDWEVPAVIAIWRMMLKIPPRPERLLNSLRACLELAIPENLPLASVILHYPGSTKPTTDVPRLLQDLHRAELDLLVEGALLKSFPPGAGAGINSALRGGPSWILRDISWNRRINRSEPLAGLPFHEWKTFSTTVLEAGELEPSLMLPQIAWFIVRRDDVLRDWRDEKTGNSRTQRLIVNSFDAKAASELFDTDHLRRVFGGADTAKFADSEIEELVRAVRSGLDSGVPSIGAAPENKSP